MAQGVDVSKLIAPVDLDRASCVGKNIAQNQPDVEVLAMLTRDFPVSEDKFNEMRGAKEFVSLQFTLLKIGSAGFSSVPYSQSTSKDKNSSMENKKRLYEDSPDGTCFYSWEKGKTNKDRGVRSEKAETDEGETIDTSVVLQPGQCFSLFMRQQSFASDNSFFVNRGNEDMLPKFSFVYLQLSTQNVEQAKKGNLIKVKKMRFLEDRITAVGPHVAASCLASTVQSQTMPRSLSEYDQRMEVGKNTKAIKSQIFQGDYMYYTVMPRDDDFVTLDEGGAFECCTNLGPPVFIDRDDLCQATSTSDPTRACKIASIAIAMGALYMMVAEAKNEDVVIRGGKARRAVMVYIDSNVFLSKHLLESRDLPQGSCLKEFHLGDDDLLVSLIEGVLFWSPRKKRVVVSGENRKRVLFCMTMQEVEAKTEAWTSDFQARLLMDGAPGRHYALMIYFAEEFASWEDICSRVQPIVRPGISLQVFPDNACAKVSRKRKSLESMDCRDDFDNFTTCDDWNPKRIYIKGEKGYSHEKDAGDADGDDYDDTQEARAGVEK
jgi:hypothetical protein